MLLLSQILIEDHELGCFADLVRGVRERAAGERFLRMDVRPPFPDTPENWEDVLEAAFGSASREP